MQTMNIQISLKFHAVCGASKIVQNYNDLGLKGQIKKIRISIYFVNITIKFYFVIYF